jgi:competence protein ComEA
MRRTGPAFVLVLDLSRSQLAVYGAICAALLVVGFRWVEGSGGGGGASQAVSFESSGSGGHAGGSGGGSFSLGGSSEDVVVDVAGAVRRPGVYRMPAGSRVNDAIARAGGASGGANLEAINLAARLSDGQQVVVPSKSAPGAASATGTSGSAAAAAATGPISLGSATPADLDTIEGIGPVTAQKIIEFRDQHGGVSSVDELSQIPGIGPATMEALRARLQP